MSVPGRRTQERLSCDVAEDDRPQMAGVLRLSKTLKGRLAFTQAAFGLGRQSTPHKGLSNEELGCES